MPGQAPKLYSIKKTTVAFAVASVFLLISLVWMVLQDSTREWKGWQRKFMELSRQKASAELEAAGKAVDTAKLAELTKQIEAARTQSKAHSDEITRVKKEIAKADVDTLKARAHYQDLKQFQDSDRYFLEEYRAHHEDEQAKAYEALLAHRGPEFSKAKADLESLEAAREGLQAKLEKFTGAEETARREAAKLTQAKTLLEKKVKKLTFDWMQMILNAPMLDFIRPSLQIQQIVLENLYDDYYFNKTQKVDRCVTCHLGIDQKGFEDAPQPFRTHPRPELFLAADSPHPLEEIGCTVCHGGSGHSASFVTAAHTPRDKKQAEAWEKKYHWHPMKHWSEKMLPLNHAEASCAKCHAGQAEMPEAPKLSQGRKLAETFGCFACHKVDGFERWKVGPNLKHVQSKLEQDWIIRWLQNPKEFRPSTKMPRIFHLRNTSDPGSASKNDAAIAAIAAYLMKNSEPIALDNPPAAGDPQKGEALVKELGCLGCHSAAGVSANHHGPELSGLGSKVKAEWLYTWLKDPKRYHTETRMPSLRLSDEEASHITSYLLSLRNEKFESIELPHVKPEVVEQMALNFMTTTKRQVEAKAELEKMSEEDRLEYLGGKMIGQQGCFGCHDIKGFENAKQIGTELSEEGSKDVEKLFFGFVPLEHTRQSWFFQKLKEPRIFDDGKELPYFEKLRMPQFDFTDEQADALVTFLLSLQKTVIPEAMQNRLDLREQQIEAGRLIVAQFHCQGCHTLDGKVGAVREIFEDKGKAPPILTGEGKKVQSPWLYKFLSGPTTIRPWLTYRMPTFGFDHAKLTELVQYFNNLDQVPPAFVHEGVVPSTEEELQSGGKLFQMFQCIKCHKSNPEPGLSASFLAPDLAVARERLRPDWVLEWLKDPQTLQEGTMMPTFFSEGQSPVPDIFEGDAAKQIKAIRDYLWIFNPEAVSSGAPSAKGTQTPASAASSSATA